MKGELVINGEGLILGRLCSSVAKRALLGQTIAIVNVENVVVTGARKIVFARYKRFVEMGEPFHGPFLRRSARDLFKRSLKRMLPYKKPRGRDAFAQVKAYKGLPARYTGQVLETVPGAHVSKVPTTKYVRLAEITRFLGGT